MYAHKIIDQDSWLTEFKVEVSDTTGAVVLRAEVYWDAEDNLVLNFGDLADVPYCLEIWRQVEPAFLAEVDQQMGAL